MSYLFQCRLLSVNKHWLIGYRIGPDFFSVLVLKLSYFLMFQISEEFEEISVQSRGFGILDVGYRSKVTVF